jgi:flagellar basal body-associated protein FliL
LRSSQPALLATAVVLAACLAFACTGPAWASAEAKTEKAGEGKAGEGKGEKPPAVPSVSMPMLVAPVMVNGQMARYVYLGVTLMLGDESNKRVMLDKIPYIQDAFLREVHGATIALGEDPDVLDEEGLQRRLLAVCAKIVGPDIVKKIELRDTAKDFK